jgi:hypothetical protein
MEETYRDPQLPGSFGGIHAVYKTLKGRVKTKDIKQWLQTKDSYTLHKPVRHTFPRNRVIVGRLNEQFQADLADMQSLANENDGYKYLLTCIDVLSKYAWSKPLKDKKAETILLAFKEIFSERTPEVLQTDAGKEFTNRLLQNYLKKKNVHFFTTHNETKASIVERFNRTLKTKMWKYFTEYNTKRYIDVLDKLMYSYNHTWHRSIKMEPATVTNKNQKTVWQNLYGKEPAQQKEIKASFKVGDTVRINKDKRHFEKGYEQNWSRELFTVSKVIPRQPTVYTLKDLMNEKIEGTFYAQELQKVVDSGFYPVEKVIKKRKIRGSIEYFVKFMGYPEKFNAWVSDVKKI